MTTDSKRFLSRRRFMQVAATSAGGALTALPVLASNGRSFDDGAAPDRTAIGELLSSEDGTNRRIHQTMDLNGTWSVTALTIDVEGEPGYQTFRRTNAERLAAHVPGEIHLDLMRAGRVEDPDISDNARTRCRWPERHSWWYRTEFLLPDGFRRSMRQTLAFDGIDLYGQIFVNGRLVGTTKDAFSQFRFDVKEFLQEGTNELVVRVTSGMELIPKPTFVGAYGDFFLKELKIDPLYSNRSWDQVHPLRKPAYDVWGNDDNDPLPNIGIWRPVRLEGRSKVVIDHVRLDTAIRDNEVSLEGEVLLENLHPWSEMACVIELKLFPPHGEPTVGRFAVGAQVGLIRVPCRMVVSDPKLWWPNGMGEQPLYRLTTRVLCENEETDSKTQSLGLRTIELDRSPLRVGSRFGFKVNGQRVFCRGGNWVPPDLIPARIDADRYAKLIAEAKNANFTMLRVWGGGLYEHDDFYDACDQRGILIWQDFTFSDGRYPDQNPEFVDVVRKEAEGVVKRLRHHPSLALWCGNNECELSMTLVWKSEPSRPEEIGGVRLYNQVLPEACRCYDPVRPYWPSSPFGGVTPGSGTSGDSHGWEPDDTSQENHLRNFQKMADDCRARFVSEAYCDPGPPNLSSLPKYLKPDEATPESTAWKIHTNAFEQGVTVAGIRNDYGDPGRISLPEFLLYGQMHQALQVGGAVEAMRFRKDDPIAVCDGYLYWSYNDMWPGTTWSIIDHYLRRKASYYWFRRAAAPVKVLVRSREGRLITRVVNDTLKSYQAVVRCGWVRIDGKASELQNHRVRIPINAMIEIASVAFPSPTERNPAEWLYVATLRGRDVPDDQAIWLSVPYRELALSEPLISTTLRGGLLEVSSSVYCHGVHLDDDGCEVLSDNYFDLLPGVPQYIRIVTPTSSGAYSLSAITPITS